MTSLADVYEGLGEEASQRQLYAGTGLFVVGAVLLVAGIVVATTGVLSPFGFNDWQSWEPAGILAGLGLPAVFLGIFTVLPASREVRAAAVIGASVAVLGVTLFAHAYPHRWIGNSPNLTPLVTLVYFLGAITTFWCLFTGVATFQSRNDPGGTVRLEVTRGGETRVVEVDRDDLPGPLDESATVVGTDGGGLDTDLLGDAPGTKGAGASGRSSSQGRGTVGLADAPRDSEIVDGSEPATDSGTPGDSGAFGDSSRLEELGAFDDSGTADPTERSAAENSVFESGEDGSTSGSGDDDSAAVWADTSDQEPADGDDIADRTAGAVRSATDAAEGADPQPASDGGATEPGIRTPADDGEVLDSRSDPADTADTYCGNCKHFQYVQTSRGIRPFCELDDGIMDDVEACDRWEPNRLD